MSSQLQANVLDYRAADLKHAKLMEYYPKDGELYLSLEGYFDDHCHCGHKNEEDKK